MLLSLHRRFQKIFEESYRKNPKSLFCRSVLKISQAVEPYKLHYKNHKYRRAFKVILQTPPFHCNPEASIEIHSMVSYHHVFMYLTAIKSFLRFYNNVAVVVHDDGNLSDQDKILLGKHIHGIKIISRKLADEKLSKLLERYPQANQCRRAQVMALQLFDCFLLAEKDKIINMDSDTLFLARPDELLAWIKGENQKIVILYEHSPLDQKEFLSKFACRFPAHVCAALMCCHRDVLGLELVENILARSEPYWTQHWCVSQNIFPVLFDAQTCKYNVSFFDESQYKVSCPGQGESVFQHYQSSSFLKNYERHIADAEKVIKEIREGR